MHHVGNVQKRGARQTDLDERVEGVLQARDQWRDRLVIDPAQPLGERIDLHLARLGDVDAVDADREHLGAQARLVQAAQGVREVRRLRLGELSGGHPARVGACG